MTSLDLDWSNEYGVRYVVQPLPPRRHTEPSLVYPLYPDGVYVCMCVM